jgi:transcriptional regulator with XRE-family HTH domain
MAASKKLPDQQQQRAREFVQRIVDEQFGKNVLDASRKIGVSQSWLYEFLHGKRGAGFKSLATIAAFASTTTDVVLGLTPAPPASERRPLGNGAIGDHPMWTETIEITRRRYGKRLTEEMIEKLERASLSFTPERLTPEFLYTVAEAIEESEPFEDPS